ncbi:2-amino-4-hydroxy-6-hydroxymethyldihydropteridine diphosphokinase [Chloroflexota bacterium]
MTAIKKAKPVYLGLGSNMGNREGNLSKAVKQMGEKVIIKALSSIYETDPVGYEQQPKFLNAVISGTTELDPFDLLNFIKSLESALGRVPNFQNGPRTIDIDILFYDNIALNTPQLTIPHPRLAERAFVLVPLSEIAPDLICPLRQKKISVLLANVEDRDGVKRVGKLKASDKTLEGQVNPVR